MPLLAAIGCALSALGMVGWNWHVIEVEKRKTKDVLKKKLRERQIKDLELRASVEAKAARSLVLDIEPAIASAHIGLNLDCSSRSWSSDGDSPRIEYDEVEKMMLEGLLEKMMLEGLLEKTTEQQQVGEVSVHANNDDFIKTLDFKSMTLDTTTNSDDLIKFDTSISSSPIPQMEADDIGMAKVTFKLVSNRERIETGPMSAPSSPRGSINNLESYFGGAQQNNAMEAARVLACLS